MHNTIKRTVAELVQKYNTDEPEELCHALGIVVVDCDLPKVTKGFCMMLKTGTAIVLNQSLDTTERRCCIAHELGHAVLHEGLNYLFMSHNTCMVTGRYEREADLFAAFLLLREIKNDETVTTGSLSCKLGLPEWAISKALLA